MLNRAADTLIIVLLVGLAGFAWQSTATPVTGTGGPRPLFTSADAIARSIEVLPPQASHHGEVARLGTMASLMPDAYSTAAGEGSGSGFAPDSPAWIVALLTDDVRLSELATMEGFELSSDPLMYGVVFLWEAGSGDLVEQRLLSNSSQYADIQQITDMSIPIYTTTPLPPMPTYDPSHDVDPLSYPTPPMPSTLPTPTTSLTP